ncbi:MAG: hypothetical protein F4Y74_10565 [Gemmatimonadales bacterium]|nr:hypothetical protein [Gemmatimonadales bacterium]MYG18735.1 hypothetical protein [Gemmatimonadales bacterium]MYH08634.1 hypothetical protein [Gemmatimonadales bacterium]
MDVQEMKRAGSWTPSPDGSFFLFASNRDGDDTQLYMMRHDGGEARKITDAADGSSKARAFTCASCRASLAPGARFASGTSRRLLPRRVRPQPRPTSSPRLPPRAQRDRVR